MAFAAVLPECLAHAEAADTLNRFMVPMRLEAVPNWSGERLVIEAGYAQD